MVQRIDLMEGILSLLVAKWGFGRVEKALAEFSPKVENDKPAKPSSTRASGKRRLLPAEMVARRKLSRRKKANIMPLAQGYENREFLPTIGDVRAFLRVRGVDSDNLTNRDQAFAKVLDLLITLPEELTLSLRNSAVHGRPATLAPVAEAITSAADQRRFYASSE